MRGSALRASRPMPSSSGCAGNVRGRSLSTCDFTLRNAASSISGRMSRSSASASAAAAQYQGLILVRFLAQRKHVLWDTLGA